MSNLVPISEARARLSQLVREAADQEVVLMNHGRPAAVLISADRYDSLLEELEDLKDRLSVHERDHVSMPLDKLIVELGLVGDLDQNPALGADHGTTRQDVRIRLPDTPRYSAPYRKRST
jgi:antitoxin StbD